MEGGEAQVNCEGLEVVLQEFLPFPDPAGIATVIHSRCGMPGLSGQTLLYLEGMENVVPDLLGSMETPSTPGGHLQGTLQPALDVLETQALHQEKHSWAG